jgi:hypothetical protein
MDSLQYNHHSPFLLTLSISPVVEVAFFPSELCSIPFSFDCNRLVRSDPRGLSIANGNGSIITFNISVTPAEEDEEVPAVFSGNLVPSSRQEPTWQTFVSWEPNPSAPLKFSIFTSPLIFFNGTHGLPFQNTYNPLFLCSSGSIVKPVVI